MRAMQIDRYIRPIKLRDGQPTAHEIRIKVSDPREQAILGKKNLTKFLASGGDRDKAHKLAQPHWPLLVAQKQQLEQQAQYQDEIAPLHYHTPTPWSPFGGFQDTPPRNVYRWRAEPRREPVTTDKVIDAWIAEREQANDRPKDTAIKAYRAKLATMFRHLRKPDDFTAISKEDLQAYRLALITGKVVTTDKRGRKPNSRDHLETIKSLFSVAARNLIADNPAREIQLPAKSDNTRLGFSDAERAMILAAARQACPAVRWAHWLAAFTATIQSELRYLTPANVYQMDGHTVVDIRPPQGVKLKTAYRPRLLPLHTALPREGFLKHVELVRREHGADAPLFDMTEAQFERATNRLVRDCGITDPRKSFYSHRHYVASELEGFKIQDEKGRVIDVSRYVAGHAAIDVHERHYVHRSLDQLATAIETLSAL